MLYATYMEVLPILDGYINENGVLNLARFETFLTKLSQIDYDHFNDVFADTKWLESRHGRKQLIEVLFASDYLLNFSLNNSVVNRQQRATLNQ